MKHDGPCPLSDENQLGVATSPYLNRPLRSEHQAREDRDGAVIQGMLIAIEGVQIVAARQHGRCTSNRGRAACAKVIERIEQLRREIAIVEVTS